MPRASAYSFLVVAWCVCSSCAPALKPATTPEKEEPAATIRPEKPAEFKLTITYSDINVAESITNTLVFRSDRVFQFIGTSPEFTVIDLVDGKVHIVDVKKAATCEIKQDQVDAAYATFIENRREEARQVVKSGESSEVADAKLELSRLDPEFTPSTPSTASAPIKLHSKTVDVSFSGVRDDERLARIHRALETLLKLWAIRNTDGIPPQAHLYVLKQLKDTYSQRPTELVFLYRIMQTPAKYRWIYEFTPTLTSREWEAARRIDKLLSTSRSVSFVRFDRIIAHEKRQPGEPFQADN